MPGPPCQRNVRPRARTSAKEALTPRRLNPRRVRTCNAYTQSGWNGHVRHVGRNARAHYYARIYHDYPDKASPGYNGYNHT
jgi:hypothetical protein